jgi:aminopeptidase-like protein
LDGRRLFSYEDHPLHVVSYSLPFDGVVTRDELMRHLYVHDRLPDAIPFNFKYYDRDWGLCCSRRLRDSLRDERYRVHIHTSFSYGTLKVGEVIAPGTTDETIVLAAHLCHPGMAVDDLSGVAVAIDVMRALLRQPPVPRRYTYRLLIVPETIGSLAWLSDHQQLIPRMKGGLFLEMLGLDHPHALQRSFAGDTAVDACFVAALQCQDPSGWVAPFRGVPGNDERQFNAPGVRVPMMSLTRVLAKTADDYPYREYHSSEDTPAIVSSARLEDSRDLVLRMIDTFERDRVPINKFAGEVCCSRYGLHIDWFTEPEAHRLMFTIMDLIDGTRSIRQMAAATGQTTEAIERVLDPLEARGLIAYDRERVS